MIRAIQDVGLADDVLRWPDDLSCGPIDSDTSSVRAAWWRPSNDDWKLDQLLDAFWERVEKFDGKLVVWFGRHAAGELAFFLNWAYRLGERPYSIIDVTGRRFPLIKRDGSAALSPPAQAVGIIGAGQLATLLGTEREMNAEERSSARQRWQQLKIENAPFRVVTENGLVSAPLDCFDTLLLKEATIEWQKMARLVGSTMGNNYKPHIQVGDHMLHARVVALIENGTLLAEGDPWDMHACRVRLAPK